MRTHSKFIRELAIKEIASRRRIHAERTQAELSGRLDTFEPSQPRFVPVRQPLISPTSPTGQLLCYKALGLVPYESLLERDFYRLIEWDYSIDRMEVQPVKIPYRKASGRSGLYVPDVAVYPYRIFRNRTPVDRPTIYEIKPRALLREQWPENRLKFRAARAFCKDAGFRFRLLTDAELNPAFIDNITFLLRFRGPRFYQRTPLEQIIVDDLHEWMWEQSNRPFTPNDLLGAIGGRYCPREQVIPWMWHLYSDYVIQCDMLKPMKMDTISWRCGDSGVGFWSDLPDWRQPENDWRR